MSKKKILQILRGSGSFGGVANYLVTRYSLMNRELIEFSFLFCQDDCLSESKYVDLINKDNIYELKALQKNNGIKEYRRLYRNLLKFFSIHNFDCIHINTGSLPITYICLKAAKKIGISNVIAHSHSSNYMSGALNTKSFLLPLKCYLQKSIYENSDYHFACSQLAAVNMFGNRTYTPVYNSIDINKFAFDAKTRVAKRKEYKVSANTVYGYVGRLTKSKNIDFIIDIFIHILSNNPEVILWIVGDGEERIHIRKRIDENHLNNNIVMFGNRNDVNELMQAMDVFIFPSLYEGLSLTVIEAQAAGLPIYMSETLSKEHKITDLVHFLPLNRDPVMWAGEIMNCKNKRKNYSEVLKNKGYDIFESVKWLENFYLKNC